MKILLIAPHFLPQYVAGAELRTYRLAKWLLKQGHHVTVLCIEDEAAPVDTVEIYGQDDFLEDIAVHRLFFNKHQWPDFRWSFDSPALQQYIVDLLRQLKPDVVHLISGFLLGRAPIAAAKALNIPIVVTLTDFWFICPTVQLYRKDNTLCWGPEPAECTRCWLNRWRPVHWLEQNIPAVSRHLATWVKSGYMLPDIVRQHKEIFTARQQTLVEILNSVQAILCITQFLADVYIKNGVSAQLFHVIPYIDEQQTDQTSGKQVKELPLPVEDDNQFHFAYIGTIRPVKGVDLLIRAFRQLNPSANVRLTIYGKISSPKYKKRLLQLSNNHPQIHFAGPYQNENIDNILEDVDVVVTPSLWHENAPRTIVEAFRANKPVVGSNVGGIAELVSDNVNGLLFERGDVTSLAEAIAKIIDNPHLLPFYQRRIPKLCTGHVEQGRVLQIYEQVLNQHDSTQN